MTIRECSMMCGDRHSNIRVVCTIEQLVRVRYERNTAFRHLDVQFTEYIHTASSERVGDVCLSVLSVPPDS